MNTNKPVTKVTVIRRSNGAKVAQEIHQEGGVKWEGSTIRFAPKKSNDIMRRYNAGGRKS